MAAGGKYGQWEEDDMSRAIDAARNGDMSVNEAARTYGVPRATLQRHLAGKNSFAVEEKKFIGSTPDLPAEVEDELVSHVLKLEECMFGITSKDMRVLAFEIAERNGIPHRFNTEKKNCWKKMVLRIYEETSRTQFTTARVHVFCASEGLQQRKCA